MKRLAALALVLALLTGCGPVAAEDGDLHILCTTYPVYLFTTAVVGDADGVAVELLVNAQTSCLHDYTLTVEDMKAIDRADVIVMNGAGLEDFLSDALTQKDVPVIDCSAGIDLLPALDHHHHEGEDEDEHEVDPHYWMDPSRAEEMVEQITLQLSALDVSGQDTYLSNRDQAVSALGSLQDRLADKQWRESRAYYMAHPMLSSDFHRLPHSIVTFHDGFQYFSDAHGLWLRAAIEEEEGAEASAQELKEIIALVQENNIPAIFVEKNGSRRSAEVIARETGCQIYELDLLMSGDGEGIEPYIQAMEQNLDAVLQAFGWEGLE